MSALLSYPQSEFSFGCTELLKANDPFGLQFEVRRFKANEHFEATTANETAWLLMSGKAVCQVSNKTVTFERHSLFDDNPSCLHLCKETSMQVKHQSDTEWLVFSTTNTKRFDYRIFTDKDIRCEHRGKGHVGNTAHRLVKTIFDDSNSPKECELVLGEVLTLPGKWSSYPPHFHPQPEIYHYRFDKSQGYGHGEMGDEVFKLKHNDTLKIAPNHDHAQVAAPGYAMYYTWAIKHLPQMRYTSPTFRKEHNWTMEEESKIWMPKDML